MAEGVVYVEGKSFTLDQQIIDAGVGAIKAALSLDVPDIENAEIVIDEPKSPGAPRTAEVVKRGMGKGQGEAPPHAHRDVLEALRAAPPCVNPAIRFSVEIMCAESSGDQQALDRAMKSGDLERAVASGERYGRAVADALVSLHDAQPVPAKDVPPGF
jgi:hypothetical protein